MTNYGILGFGHHAERRLMPGFALAERSQPVAFWRNNQDRAQETAVHYGLKSHPTVEALCAAPEVEAIFLTSPDALHLAHAEIALRHGKPVLCEKPMAMNAAECEQMIALAEQYGRLLGVAHVFRFDESLHRVRQWVAEGRLGRVLSARSEFCYPGLHSPRTWITDPALAAGGPTGDVGVHCVDSLRFVLQQEATAVQALMRSDEHSGAVEASAAISIEFDGGTLADVFVTTRAPYRTYLELIGTERTVEARNAFTVDAPVELVLLEQGKEIERVPCDNHRAYGLQFDAFSDAVRTGAAFPCTGRDGWQNQRILDAAYESARTGRKVSL